MLFQTTNLSSPVPITLTANGVYTEPNGLGYSPVTVNVSGGGVGIAKAIIKASYSQGSTCVCTQGSFSYQSDNSGNFLFCLPVSGTWTVTCGTSVKQIVTSDYGYYEANFAADALKAKCKVHNYCRLSNAIGDKCTTDGRWFERTTDEPVLMFTGSSSIYCSYILLCKNNGIDGTYSSDGKPTFINTYVVNGITLYVFGMNAWPIGSAAIAIKTDGTEETMDKSTGVTFTNNVMTVTGTYVTEFNEIIAEYATL